MGFRSTLYRNVGENLSQIENSHAPLSLIYNNGVGTLSNYRNYSFRRRR